MPPPSLVAVFPETVLVSRRRKPPASILMPPPSVAELPVTLTLVSATVPAALRPPPNPVGLPPDKVIWLIASEGASDSRIRKLVPAPADRRTVTAAFPLIVSAPPAAVIV